MTNKEVLSDSDRMLLVDFICYQQESAEDRVGGMPDCNIANREINDYLVYRDNERREDEEYIKEFG